MSIDYKNLELKQLNYGSYLKIPELLKLQEPISRPFHHDEMFFIIIHQAAELWFKEMLHETLLLKEAFRQNQVSRCLKILSRITGIMELMVSQIRLLATLTPVEFAGFRDNLKPASGFQSIQFRKIEFHFGIREDFFLKFFSSMPDVVKEFQDIQKTPTVYDDFIHCLHLNGYKIPDVLLQRDFSQSHSPNEAFISVLKEIYQEPKENYHLVLLCEKLIDFDERFVLWRNAHVLMVARTIGFKKGTGGSAGYKFLEQRLNLKCFPDLWELRNHIGQEHGAY